MGEVGGDSVSFEGVGVVHAGGRETFHENEPRGCEVDGAWTRQHELLGGQRVGPHHAGLVGFTDRHQSGADFLHRCPAAADGPELDVDPLDLVIDCCGPEGCSELGRQRRQVEGVDEERVTAGGLDKLAREARFEPARLVVETGEVRLEEQDERHGSCDQNETAEQRDDQEQASLLLGHIHLRRDAREHPYMEATGPSAAVGYLVRLEGACPIGCRGLKTARAPSRRYGGL